MDAPRRSIFALPGGPRAKWLVLILWVLGIVIAAGPANLPAKFSDAEENESTSFLPGDAESTKALGVTEDLQGGELAPAVIVYRRESGLTPADRAQIATDARGLTKKRFSGVVADGATAAAGGRRAGGSRSSARERERRQGGGTPRERGAADAEGCAGPTSPVAGQPRDYRPFVGPICSPDGKAAIVTAYLRGNGDSSTLLDPIEAWRRAVSDPGGGLQVKITGGAGYSADAIKVFESINGTLLLAAVSLVIFLLILIYRSPVFLFIPLVAVMFAETLSRSVGYGLSELGVTINGQSSSIMSILVLGAGTDYALLIVARYREELHATDDPHVATRAAMRSAGPAVFASAATVITALFCLTLAKVNGTAGLGPIGAMGVACAAFSMLTLLPALLTIFGRRAFWPFVPHTEATAPADEVARGALGRRIAEGSALGAPAAGDRGIASGLRTAAGGDRDRLGAPADRVGHPGPAADPLARRSARRQGVPPLRAASPPSREALGRHPRLLETGGRPRGVGPAAGHGRVGGPAAGAQHGPGLLLHRPDPPTTPTAPRSRPSPDRIWCR